MRGLKLCGYAGFFGAGLALSGCGGKNGHGPGAGVDPGGFNLSDFVNTASKQDVVAKGHAAEGYFKDLDQIRGHMTAASGAGNGLVRMLAFADAANATRPSNAPATDEVCTVTARTTEVVNGESVPVTVESCTHMDDGLQVQCERRTYDLGGGGTSVREVCSGAASSTDVTTTSDGSRQSSSPTAETSDAPNFAQSFGQITDCNSAFTSFESLYSGTKSEISGIVAMLSGPSEASVGGGNQVKLEPAKAGSDAALSYQFAPASVGSGFKISGSVSGGANGDILVLKQNYDMSIDLGAMTSPMPPSSSPTPPSGASMPEMPDMPGAPNMPNMPAMTMETKITETSAVNLTTQTIEQKVAMTLVNQQSGGSVSSEIGGVILISAGDDKHVKLSLTTKTTSAENAQEGAQDLEARLVDDHTLVYSGTVRVGGQSGTFGFTVVRTGTSCAVKDIVNSVPQASY